LAESSSLIAQFDERHGLYNEYCERLKVLLAQLLKQRGLTIHSISARLKSRESYLKKISAKGSAYQAIGDITDVAGIRVITYFADQVDEIARVIENEFIIDAVNTIDKRSALDPDRFGYLSLHYVVSLSASRSGLTEYRALQGLKAEIQIRSILQHAWAEMEHDLGYKTTHEIPRSTRRQFARLAGLLELADNEFVGIRTALEAYSRSISARIAEQPNSVEINRISLVDFAKTDDLVRRLDEAIARNLKYHLVENDDSIASDVEKLRYFGLTSIADVRRELDKSQQTIIELSEIWAGKVQDTHDPTMAEGI
jgi:ppGpp synthetase/RelA/SpoT-type nucleotidyltranferase